MRGIDHDLLGIFLSDNIINYILRFRLAFFLLKSDFCLCRMHGDKLKRILYLNADARDLPRFKMLCTEHTLVHIGFLILIKECSAGADKTGNTRLHKLFI